MSIPLQLVFLKHTKKQMQDTNTLAYFEGAWMTTKSGRIRLQIVIVGSMCGAAVLRGADVYAPGVNVNFFLSLML